jgi:hypothetical protein
MVAHILLLTLCLCLCLCLCGHLAAADPTRNIEVNIPHPMKPDQCMNITTRQYSSSREAVIDENNKICIIASLFTADGSSQLADQVVPLIKIDDPSFEYFMFTNIPSLQAPGWPLYIIENPLPYDRAVTKSRVPKFLAWTIPETSSCRVFFYQDALYSPISDKKTWRNASMSILQSRDGIMQYPHHIQCPEGTVCSRILQEMRITVKGLRDSRENVLNTTHWIISQWENVSLSSIYETRPYLNTYFGYDPGNDRFRQQVCAFWEIYAEEKLSFRDQAIWATFLMKFGMHPIPIPVKMFKLTGKKGFGGHQYAPQYKNKVQAMSGIDIYETPISNITKKHTTARKSYSNTKGNNIARGSTRKVVRTPETQLDKENGALIKRTSPGRNTP